MKVTITPEKGEAQAAFGAARAVLRRFSAEVKIGRKGPFTSVAEIRELEHEAQAAQRAAKAEARDNNRGDGSGDVTVGVPPAGN